MMKKVLLVDDDPRYLELVEMMLEGEGLIVATEANGERLIEHAMRFEPDVIVMDIMLQQQNGIELAHEFRRAGGKGNVPIVFVSAWTGKSDLKLPRNSSRLFKPFTQSEIVTAIYSVMGVTSTVGVSNE